MFSALPFLSALGELRVTNWSLLGPGFRTGAGLREAREGEARAGEEGEWQAKEGEARGAPGEELTWRTGGLSRE